MQAELTLSIRLQEKLFADPRRIALLRRLKETGSITQGARLAGISYKSAWDAVNEMNKLANQTVVERSTGGKGGGGACLTRYGDRLLQLYGLLEQIQQKAFDVLQDESLPLDTLLAAIARFSLQTSARNQLYGTVSGVDAGQVQHQLKVRLHDGTTTLRVALTQRSAERLQLTAGKEVLVLIKAPWIDIATADLPVDNQLSATVKSIESGESHSEVLLALTGGGELCATLANPRIARLNLHVGMAVRACFSAEHAIIATLI